MGHRRARIIPKKLGLLYWTVRRPQSRLVKTPRAGESLHGAGGRAALPYTTQGYPVKKQIVWMLCKYGLGVGLLAWVVWLNWDGLANALERPINVQPLLLAITLCLGSVLLTFVRWYVLVRAQGLPFTLPNAFRLGSIGFALNTFLPGSVGGDIIKATCIAREQSRRTVAVATVLLDRAIGLAGLFWLVALVGSWFWATGYLGELVVSESAAQTLEFIVLGAAILTAGSLAFWLVLGVLPSERAERLAERISRIPKVGHSLAEFWRAVWMYRCRGRSVGLAILLAMIGHVGFVLTFYFASLTLNQPGEVPALGAHFLVVPVGMSIEAGFPAPGGMGGGEVGYGELYKRVGCTFDRGVLGSLSKRVIMWIVASACYLLYLLMRPSLRPAPGEEEDPVEPAEAPPDSCAAGPPGLVASGSIPE
jgi:uncharacterized protein (TIRG00374 family)